MEHKLHILCTRSLSAALVEKAAEQGIIVDIIPFIETRSLQQEGLIRKMAELTNQRIAAVFSSQHAVESVISLLNNKKPDWTIFCLEGRTQQSASAYFGKSRIAGTAGSAGTLAGLIIAQKNIDEVFFFCGSLRRDELPDQLKEQRIRVTEIIVYETLLKPVSLTKNYDGILFFSPSAVESFFTANRPGKRTILFAIGDTTAGGIKPYSGNPIAVSRSPDEETMMDTVFNYYQTHPADQP